ncbi:Chromosome segregation in meiosis protein 3 [Candida viswanathii]|uniref:Chromosome segregation in meiosis protein n=1 Tax=Candida viswanathii TaxID=5486 RepID=A0A367YLA6_9ASCO|nr:Chromosome segregation in meiosis protein 3 [Candida viswanathii]
MSSIIDEIEEGIDVSRTEDEPTTQNLQPSQAPKEKDNDDVLGLDKPIKLRTRAKIARMDNARIFSPNGLPYLVKNHSKLTRTIQKNDKKFYSNPRSSITKSQKFEHEFDNLSSVLQFYQLWCHGLFPKANFKDCIGLVRSLNGKSAQLRLYRRELINAELHKLKVAKGIIVEDANITQDEEQPMQDSNDWGSMHREAVTADNAQPPQNVGSGLQSLFVDSDEEDLTPTNGSSLFVGMNRGEDLTVRNEPPSMDVQQETTTTVAPVTATADNESDDPFSDDDDIKMSMTQAEPSSFDIDQHQQEQHHDDGDEDLELELMRQNDS